MGLKMSRDDLARFVAAEFAQAASFRLGDVSEESLSLHLDPTDDHLRPGGTVSGPVMFALADVAFYLAVLSRIGPQALAVTTSCHIDFMRKPAAGAALTAEARILKLGRSLAVGDVMIGSDGTEGAVARASLTYALPRS